MGVLVLKTAFFTLLAVGCIKTPMPPPAPNMHDMSNHAGPTFTTTHSPCLVNLGNECKTLVEIQGKGAITAVQCHQAKTKNSPWDKYTFYVIGDHKIPPPPHAIEFCIDLSAAIYIRERPSE
jgi:hypothetical protein